MRTSSAGTLRCSAKTLRRGHVFIKRFTLATLVACLCAAAAHAPARAAASPAPPAATPPAAPAATADAVTHQSLTLNGKTYAYTSRAGTIALENQGKPGAKMFYTAFTVDGVDSRTRPVTFFYNGGPGSSTIWLRMGSFGPMRVQLADAGGAANAPFHLVPNQYSLLDRSDLVFVDAPGTGFSRVLGKTDQYYGVDQDMRAFAQFVNHYVSAFGRWNSPKFLFGESYGTPRTAVLVNNLQNQGVGINGVVLLSSVLDFNLDWDINFTPVAVGGGDWAFPLYLPTEAAAAWYHHVLPGPQTTLDSLLPQVEQFAMGEYLNALAQGSNLSPQTYNDVVAKLHQYTGLSDQYIRRSNLRIPYWRFTTELLRDSGQTLGRYDARYTSYALDKVADRPEFDATDSAIDAAFVGAGNYYIRDLLRYNPSDEYLPLAFGINRQWDWKHNGNLPTNTAQDLAHAMTFNPKLHVFSANGYYDMATPFFATVYTLNHLSVAPAVQNNISYGFYESGHMVYLHPEALARFHDDLERWYGEVLGAAPSTSR
jgi:carboxypeptidase C (cathepsin A)